MFCYVELYTTTKQMNKESAMSRELHPKNSVFDSECFKNTIHTYAVPKNQIKIDAPNSKSSSQPEAREQDSSKQPSYPDVRSP